MQFNLGFLDVWTLVHILLSLLIGVLLRRKYWYVGLIIIVGYELLENLVLIMIAPDFFGEQFINILSDTVFGVAFVLVGSYISVYIFNYGKIRFKKLNWELLLQGISAVLFIVLYYALILFYASFIPSFNQFYEVFALGFFHTEPRTTAYLQLGFAVSLFAIDMLFALYLGVQRNYRRSFIYLYEVLNFFILIYFFTQSIVTIIWSCTINALFLLFTFHGIIVFMVSFLIFIQILVRLSKPPIDYEFNSL